VGGARARDGAGPRRLSVTDATGDVEIVWTGAQLANDERSLVMPVEPGSSGQNWWFTLRVLGLPDGEDSITIEFQDIQLSDVHLDPPDDEVNEITLSARYEFAVEPLPALDEPGQDSDSEPTDTP
jgi:hypothetical protein